MALILVDIDDTTLDISSPWIGWLNSKYNLHADPSQRTQWDMHPDLFPQLTDEQFAEPHFYQEYWDSCRLMKNAARFLKLFRYNGHDVRFCTAGWFGTIEPRVKRLMNLLPWFDPKQLITTYDKSIVLGDFIIDDNPNHIRSSPATHKILYSNPGNLYYDCDVLRREYRADTWDQVYLIVEHLCRKLGEIYVPVHTARKTEQESST